jgi:DNA-binding MarR family transcriptional regulator
MSTSKAALMDVIAAIGGAYYQDLAVVAARYGLTPVQAKVLGAAVRAPLPMRALAEQLVCDASNVTGIVDRLEARGLVRREAGPQDRRIKIVTATDEGRAALHAVREDMESVNDALGRLTDAERDQLYDILRKLLPALSQATVEAATT